MTASLAFGGSASSIPCSSVLKRVAHFSIIILVFPIRLSLHASDVPVLQYREPLDGEPVRVVVRAARVQQAADRYQRAFRHVALADNHLPCVCPRLVGIAVEVADHAVHLKHLIDVPRYDAVVETLLREVGVVVVRAPVRQQQRALHVVFDGALLRREGEEKLVEAAHVFPCFRRAVLRQVLRECEHQALAPVKDVYFLPLRFGEAEGAHHRADYHEGARRRVDDSEQPYLPEWKSHSTLPLLATQNYPFWLKYD